MNDEKDFAMVTTRGGDRGETSLYNGERRRKDDLLFEALGDLDELSSFLGAARAAGAAEVPGRLPDGLVEGFQRNILRIGARIATPPDDPLSATLKPVTGADVEDLEGEEKRLLLRTRIEPVFVLPGGYAVSAAVDVARAVCRRAERRLVSLIRDRGRTELADAQRYLNRLSDFLFVLARNLDGDGGR